MLRFPPLWGELRGLLLWLLNFTFPSVFVSHTSMMAQIIEDKKGSLRVVVSQKKTEGGGLKGLGDAKAGGEG